MQVLLNAATNFRGTSSSVEIEKAVHSQRKFGIPCDNTAVSFMGSGHSSSDHSYGHVYD